MNTNKLSFKPTFTNHFFKRAVAFLCAFAMVIGAISFQKVNAVEEDFVVYAGDQPNPVFNDTSATLTVGEGGTYANIQLAINAANDKDTIKILNDLTLTAALDINYKSLCFTADTGVTITSAPNKRHILIRGNKINLKDINLKFNNVTLKGSPNAQLRDFSDSEAPNYTSNGGILFERANYNYTPLTLRLYNPIITNCYSDSGSMPETGTGEGNAGGAVSANRIYLEIYGGKLNDNNSLDFGGAVMGSIVTLNNVEMKNNKAQSGGGAVATLGNFDSTTHNPGAGSGETSYNGKGSLNITDCIIEGNSATRSNYGGGVDSHYGDLYMTGSTVNDNTATMYGGGVYSGYGLYIKNSAISGNTSVQTEGGGISNGHASPVIITNSRIENNTAKRGGGGLYIYGTTVRITDSFINGNIAKSWSTGTAEGAGGGARIMATETIISDTEINKNSASYGGGIFTDSATLNNVTMKENKASHTGGGIYSQSNISINDSELSENFANYVFNPGTMGSGSGNLQVGQGGAIAAGGSVTIKGSTLNKNNATGWRNDPAYGKGGAIYVGGSSIVNISDTQITNNEAYNGGGIATSNISNINVTSDVTFSGNTASSWGYWKLGTSANSLIHIAQILTDKFSTFVPEVGATPMAFTNAYSNYDIYYGQSPKTVKVNYVDENDNSTVLKTKTFTSYLGETFDAPFEAAEFAANTKNWTPQTGTYQIKAVNATDSVNVIVIPCAAAITTHTVTINVPGNGIVGDANEKGTTVTVDVPDGTPLTEQMIKDILEENGANNGTFGGVKVDGIADGIDYGKTDYIESGIGTTGTKGDAGYVEFTNGGQMNVGDDVVVTVGYAPIYATIDVTAEVSPSLSGAVVKGESSAAKVTKTTLTIQAGTTLDEAALSALLIAKGAGFEGGNNEWQPDDIEENATTFKSYVFNTNVTFDGLDASGKVVATTKSADIVYAETETHGTVTVTITIPNKTEGGAATVVTVNNVPKGKKLDNDTISAYIKADNASYTDGINLGLNEYFQLGETLYNGSKNTANATDWFTVTGDTAVLVVYEKIMHDVKIVIPGYTTPAVGADGEDGYVAPVVVAPVEITVSVQEGTVLTPSIIEGILTNGGTDKDGKNVAGVPNGINANQQAGEKDGVPNYNGKPITGTNGANELENVTVSGDTTINITYEKKTHDITVTIPSQNGTDPDVTVVITVNEGEHSKEQIIDKINDKLEEDGYTNGLEDLQPDNTSNPILIIGGTEIKDGEKITVDDTSPKTGTVEFPPIEAPKIDDVRVGDKVVTGTVDKYEEGNTITVTFPAPSTNPTGTTDNGDGTMTLPGGAVVTVDKDGNWTIPNVPITEKTDGSGGGTWTVDVPNGSIPLVDQGRDVTATQQDKTSGNSSGKGETEIKAPNTVETPNIDPITAGETKVTGTVDKYEEGNTITVTFPAGTGTPPAGVIVGEVGTPDEGKWIIEGITIKPDGNGGGTWEVDVPSVVVDGAETGVVLDKDDVVEAVQKNPNTGVTSSKDTETVTATPTIDTVVEGDKTIGGTGEPGKEIVITIPGKGGNPDTIIDKDKDGNPIIVDGGGNWEVELPAALLPDGTNPIKEGDKITIVQKEPGVTDGKEDKAETVVIAPPHINPVTEGEAVISGTGEPGKEIIITITDKDGNPIKDGNGNVVTIPNVPVGKDGEPDEGKWIVVLPPGVELKADDKITVVQIEPGDTTKKPLGTDEEKVSALPKIDPVDEGDKVVTGTGEPGKEIVITFPDGTVVGDKDDNKIIVDTDGTWTVPVPDDLLPNGKDPLKDGEKITVIQVDPITGNKDPATEITVGGFVQKLVISADKISIKDSTGVQVINWETKVTMPANVKDIDSYEIKVKFDVPTGATLVGGKITLTVDGKDVTLSAADYVVTDFSGGVATIKLSGKLSADLAAGKDLVVGIVTNVSGSSANANVGKEIKATVTGVVNNGIAVDSKPAAVKFTDGVAPTITGTSNLDIPKDTDVLDWTWFDYIQLGIVDAIDGIIYNETRNDTTKYTVVVKDKNGVQIDISDIDSSKANERYDFYVTATDAAGNQSATSSFGVMFVEAGVPTINANDLEVEIGTVKTPMDYLKDIKALAKDKDGKAIDPKDIEIVLPAGITKDADGNLVFGTLSPVDKDFEVTLKVTVDGKTSEITVKVKVVHKNGPDIVANDIIIDVIDGGQFKTPLSQDALLKLAGALVSDAFDKGLNLASATVAITGYSDIAFKTIGSNTMTITAKDSAGNETSKVFQIRVVDRIRPIITAKSPQNYEASPNKTVTWEQFLIDIDASVTDNFDPTVKIENINSGFSAIDFTKDGTYIVYLNAKDKTGNPNNHALPFPVTVIIGAGGVIIDNGGGRPDVIVGGEATTRPQVDVATPDATAPVLRELVQDGRTFTAQQTGENPTTYDIFDANGPLGSITIPEGKTIDDINIEDALTPQGSTKLKTNPKTGDNNAVPFAAIVTLIGAVAFVTRRKIKLVK